jgi:5-methylcytosine-specific restriction enzyme A
MPTQPPKWTWSEDVLAMDLYVRLGIADGAPLPSGTRPEVVALSELLRGLPIHADRPPKFRNVAGVAAKLANLYSVQYPGHGRPNISRVDRRVWEQFSGEREQLKQIADAIRVAAELSMAIPDEDDLDDEHYPREEGAVLMGWHKRRERDRRLGAKKRSAHLQRYGRLFCTVCQFDFEVRYGVRGNGYIQCHHILPLASGVRTTRLVDLELVCSNCHAMLHRGKPWVSPDDLRKEMGVVAATGSAPEGRT